MKRICKIFAVLLVMAIALFSFSITAGATEVSNTQDGLVASITSEKDSYKSNEDIELTFKVTNNNDFAVENVSLEAIIPKELKLKSKNDTSINTVSLTSGESLELTLTAVKESSVITVPIGDSTELNTENTSAVQTDSIQATTTKVNSATSDTVSTNDSDNTTIQTGNTISYLLVELICLVCLAVAVISFRFRKKAVKYLSLVLCVCIAVGSVAFVSVTNTMAEETTQNMSFKFSKTITVDNEEYNINAIVKYTSSTEISDDEFVPSRDADTYIDDDLYTTATDKSHIQINSKTEQEYIDNELILFASDTSTKNDILSLVKSYNGKIVGCAYGTYQIRFSKSYTYYELEDIKNLFEKSHVVRKCFINSPAPEVEGTAYYPKNENNRWNNDWDSIPSGVNWGVEAIKAPGAWEYMDYMQKVNVGVFDKGFDIDHEDFVGLQCHYTSTEVKKDENDHGTHVAGTIGAIFDNGIGTDGIFPKAQLSLINVANASLDKTKFSGVVAMKYLIESQKCKVINVSMGYANKSLIYGASQNNENAINFINEHAEILTECLNELIEKKYDFVICQAAGNENNKLFEKNDKSDYGYDKKLLIGENNGCDAKYSYVYSAIENVKLRNRIIVVGAIQNKSDTTAKTNYSLCDFSNIGDRVDVVAPGYDIESTISNNEYDKMNGTSMASPHVAGTAAMLYSLNPDLTGDEVKRIICETATTEVDGYKLVDAEAAVKKVMGQGSLNAKVISSDSNEPLSHVKATAYLKLKSGNKLVHVAWSDVGNVSFEELYGGSYEIKLEKEGYKTTTITTKILKGVTDMTYTYKPIVMEKEEISIFESMPKHFIFSSGVGGWSTCIDVENDGSFTGQYHDVDMGVTGNGYPNGTVSICNFKGKFSQPNELDKYTYSMKLESLELEDTPGDEYYENGVRYIYSSVPYGLNNADEFLIYLPGILIDDLPTEFVLWSHVNTNTTITLPCYGIYNVNGKMGFVSYENENHNENNGKIYLSNVIQKYNEKVYYCSSDGSPSIMNLPRLDFSNTGLGYKKLPINIHGGVQSFIIYNENIYYISDYKNIANSSGVYSAGNLYMCDINGNNNVLIANNVTHLCFKIVNNKLYYNTLGDTVGKSYYNSYNIETGKTSFENDFDFVSGKHWLFLFDDNSGQSMGFDGGYYYYSNDYGKTETINGELANVYYYREDMITGEIKRIGYSYSQTV